MTKEEVLRIVEEAYPHLKNGNEISKWKPGLKDIYYYPDLTCANLYEQSRFYNNEYGKIRLKHNLICRTPEEAIEKAEKMLNAIKD